MERSGGASRPLGWGAQMLPNGAWSRGTLAALVLSALAFLQQALAALLSVAAAAAAPSLLRLRHTSADTKTAAADTEEAAAAAADTHAAANIETAAAVAVLAHAAKTAEESVVRAAAQQLGRAPTADPQQQQPPSTADAQQEPADAQPLQQPSAAAHPQQQQPSATLPELARPAKPWGSADSLTAPSTPPVEDSAAAVGAADAEGSLLLLPAAPKAGSGWGDEGQEVRTEGGLEERRFAYVTLLTRDGYLPGVQALARSLHAARAAHPLLVMYTPATLSSRALAALLEEGCRPVAVEGYNPEGTHDVGQYKLALYAECWTKLRMWEMEGYERLVYLDADMVTTRNIDSLFSLPADAFYAAGDCAYGRATQAEREACSLYRPRPHYFNAGFFVMTPCRAELARFGALLRSGAVQTHLFQYAEQDFLNAVYHGSWRALPITFNAQKAIRWHHPELWAAHEAEVAVIHYTDAKPWHRNHPEHAFYPREVALWWDIFERRFVPAPPAHAHPLPDRPASHSDVPTPSQQRQLARAGGCQQQHGSVGMAARPAAQSAAAAAT